MVKAENAGTGTKAIVIGGSISGLLVAKVLSEHFDKVQVLEKDHQPDIFTDQPGAVSRKGLPQAAHQHILLLKGRQLFEEFFPGFDRDLEHAGAPLVNYSEDVALFIGDGKLPRFASGLDLRVCRRPLIDTLVIRRISQLENVELSYGVTVKSLALNASKERVCGVHYLKNGGLSETFFSGADLVIDCSGRGSRMPQWLGAEGLSEAPCTRVNPKLAYASQLYIPEEGKAESIHAVEVAPHAPDSPRAAGFWPVENGHWLLTLIGMNGVYPGKEASSFNSFARQLATPAIDIQLENLKPVSGITQFKGTENVWRRYDQMKDHPAGLLVMGDAMCAFNPLYGQGLTLIAMAAKTLGRRLRSGCRQNFSKTWLRSTYKRFNRFFLAAWMVAVSEDMRWPATEGRNVGWHLKLAYRYMDNLLAACVRSKTLSHRCLSVANMVSSPLVLIRPDTVFLALWHSRRTLSQSFIGEKA